MGVHIMAKLINPDWPPAPTKNTESVLETFKNVAKEYGKNPTEGRKFDGDKLDWSLLPIEGVEPIIEVLMYGARKYAPGNWAYVEDGERRYYNAAMRHMTAWQKGEHSDSETGISHLAHAACCILFLIAKEEIQKNNVK
jgi:hypothetical protein